MAARSLRTRNCGLPQSQGRSYISALAAAAAATDESAAAATDKSAAAAANDCFHGAGCDHG